MKQVGVKILNKTVCEVVNGFKEAKPVGVLCAGGEMKQDTCTVSTFLLKIIDKIENNGENIRT